MQQLGWLALSAQISYTVTLEQQTVVQQHNDVNMQCKQFCTHNASWPGGGTVQHLGPNCLCQNVRTHHKPFIGFWQPRKAGLSIQTGKSCIHKIHKPVPRCLSAELSQVWSARLRNWVLTGTIFSSLWVTVRYLKQSWVFILQTYNSDIRVITVTKKNPQQRQSTEFGGQWVRSFLQRTIKSGETIKW